MGALGGAVGAAPTGPGAVADGLTTTGFGGVGDVVTGRYAGALAQPASPAADSTPTGRSRSSGLERSMFRPSRAREPFG